MSLLSRATAVITADNTADDIGSLFFDIVDAIEAGVLLASNTLSTSNLTTSGCDVDFPKAIGPNSANYIYSLYSGDEDSLISRDTIESQTLQDSGTDVDKLSLPLIQEQLTFFNVLLEDPLTGFKRVYTVDSELALDEPEPPVDAPSIISDQIVEDSEGITVPYTEVSLVDSGVEGEGYNIEVLNTDTTAVIILPIDNDYFLFDDLPWTHVEGTVYEFRVYGYNDDGDGPKSPPIGWETNTYGAVTATTSFTTA